MSSLPEYIRSEREAWLDSDKLERQLNSPADINNGYCKQFAKGVKDRFPDQLRLRTYGYDSESYVSHAHAWIEYNGRHYDAECPDGVGHPRELPLFQRAGIDPLDDHV